MKNLNKMAREFFGVEIPISSIILKKSYRKQCLKLHPDTGGDVREFKDMQEAYKTLIDNSPIVFSEDEYKKINRTTDGTLLSELGLGLGDTTNGIDCDVCNHRGYTIGYQPTVKTCGSCDGEGVCFPKIHCKNCRGLGKVGNRTCEICDGKGFIFDCYNIPKSFRCKKCDGIGIYYKEDKSNPYYLRCHKCHGTGEIPMFNPVILKSVLRDE